MDILFFILLSLLSGEYGYCLVSRDCFVSGEQTNSISFGSISLGCE